MSGLTTKLGVKPGERICLVDPTLETAIQIVEALPSGARPHPYIPEAAFDLIFYWPREVEALSGQFAGLQSQIAPAGAIWAILPKKKYARARGIEFTWADMQNAALVTDLVDNKKISLTEVEYGTRFVVRKDRR